MMITSHFGVISVYETFVLEFTFFEKIKTIPANISINEVINISK